MVGKAANYPNVRLLGEDSKDDECLLLEADGFKDEGDFVSCKSFLFSALYCVIYMV